MMKEASALKPSICAAVHLCALALFVLSGSTTASAAIYSLMGARITYFFNGHDCHGACVRYDGSERVVGYFETYKPLPSAQVEADISANLKRYRFTDGHTVFSSEDSKAHVAEFSVGTDAKGFLTSRNIVLQQFTGFGTLKNMSKPAPRLNAISLFMSGDHTAEGAFAAALCKSQGKGPAATSSVDTCLSLAADTLTSRAEHDPKPAKQGNLVQEPHSKPAAKSY
jgi:hypothetical protein